MTQYKNLTSTDGCLWSHFSHNTDSILPCAHHYMQYIPRKKEYMMEVLCSHDAAVISKFLNAQCHVLLCTVQR